MKTLYMMIGAPGSGKDTFIKNHICNKVAILSTDNYIENVAKNQGKTYSEVFSDNIKAAEQQMNSDIQALVTSKVDNISVVWNQTNLSKKSRAKKIARFEGWNIIAIDIRTNVDVLLARNELRKSTGRGLRENLIVNMLGSYEPPSLEEGFSSIWTIKG